MRTKAAMPLSNAEGTLLSELATDDQINAFLQSFSDLKERREALVLTEWLFTEGILRLTSLRKTPAVKRGGDPPDFLISDASKKTIAVEVSTFVTERKRIYDKAPAFPGGYTSTLRRGKADAAFHAAIKKKHLLDDSWVRPHFENSVDLDRDYYQTIGPVLAAKVKDAKQYSNLYDHTVILIEDSLSEFERVLERRLPSLRDLFQSLRPPDSVQGVVMNIGKRRAGKAHQL